MFNELLTQKGYVVLDIDYRGSAGYGRDWRTDVYDFLGGKDYEDHIDSIDFMVKNYAVDTKRVGVYGGSYGGFMAGMLVMRAPEQDRGGGGSSSGFRLEKLLLLVARLHGAASRLSRQKRRKPTNEVRRFLTPTNLQKPLLILHGLVDNNVPRRIRSS